MLPQIASGVLGFLLASALMPWVMAVARANDLLDYPDSERRVHVQPVPRLGGVAIFTATIVASAAIIGWDYLSPAFRITLAPSLPGVLAGALVIFVTGIIDDLKGVKPLAKLLAQTIAAICVVAYGFSITRLTVAGASVVSLGI